MSQSQYTRAILIVARDPVIGSLVGELVGLCGHRPLYPNTDESVARTFARVTPDVVLLDADHEQSSDTLLLSACRARGVPVVYFAGGLADRELESFAARHHALAFPLPNGPRRLVETLERALAQ